MAEQQDGGPAFPQAFAMSPKPDQGMSLRDHFASQALVGLMGRAWDASGLTNQQLVEQWCASSYIVADAMLRARQFPPSGGAGATAQETP